MKKIICFFAAILCVSTVAAADLDEQLRATQSDIRVFCPAMSPDEIQWGPLMHLSQKFGAEVYVALIQPAPAFGALVKNSKDGRFYMGLFGRPPGIDDSLFVDSLLYYLFDEGYPDIAIFGAAEKDDSAVLAGLLNVVKAQSVSDSSALLTLDKIYYQVKTGGAADVLFNDEEIYNSYRARAASIDELFKPAGPLSYQPQRIRRYKLMNPPPGGKMTSGDFISGFDTFRLPNLIDRQLHEGPEKRNLLNRLGHFRSYMRAAAATRLSAAERLRLIITGYGEIKHVVETIAAGAGTLNRSEVLTLARRILDKAYRAVELAAGIEWAGYLEFRTTPFGKAGKLKLDLNITGPVPVELSYFRYHPAGRARVTIDSLSKIITPHQKFYREYEIDLSPVELKDAGDSLLFSLEVVVEGLTLELYLPYREYSDTPLSLSFLPGYAFLAPFKEGDITALAQTFDWQLFVSKPYAAELNGTLEIETPDGVVVGTYDKNLQMPQGLTGRYIDVHLAAGRSIGYDQKKVTATVKSSGQTVASTSAEVRVVRCEVPETRNIGFIPDPEGRLEDFLRMGRFSFQPFTVHSLISADLEAYDLIIIGSDAKGYQSVLREVNGRLRDYVKNGGEILIMGQSFGWPEDIFNFPIYTARAEIKTVKVTGGSHDLVSKPYNINSGPLLDAVRKSHRAFPAIMVAGTEIISAGEQGSYLKVSKIGDGHVIYCGLPLFEMAAELNVEAIHLIANLLNFGKGY